MLLLYSQSDNSKIASVVCLQCLILLPLNLKFYQQQGISSHAEQVRTRLLGLTQHPQNSSWTAPSPARSRCHAPIVLDRNRSIDGIKAHKEHSFTDSMHTRHVTT